MATYVLVHGGGHGGWCYQRVARILRAERARGLHADTHRPRRTRPPARRASVDLHRHIEDVVAVLHYEDLRDVILVGHSYGGHGDHRGRRPGRRPGRAPRLPRRRHTASTASRSSTWPGRSSRRSAPSARSSTGWSWCCCPAPDAGLLYGVTDADDLAWMAERLTAAPLEVLRTAARAHQRGSAVGHPAVPHRVHLDPGHPGPRADGPGASRGPALGHRHRPRPDDHRARAKTADALLQVAARLTRDRCLRPCMSMTAPT